MPYSMPTLHTNRDIWPVMATPIVICLSINHSSKKETLLEGLAPQIIECFLSLEERCSEIQSEINQLDTEYGSMTLGLNDMLWRSASAPDPTLDDAALNRYWIGDIFNCLDHRHDGDGRDTWQMAGVLVVPNHIIEKASLINTHKQHFADLIHAYRAQQTSTNTGQQKPTIEKLFSPEKMQQIAGSAATSRHLLQRQGKFRVHIRHVTRQIVCLKSYPKFMSLSWVRQRRSIQKVSLDQCMKRLEKLNRDSTDRNIDIQIELLKKVPLNQHHLLRVVQTVAYPSIKTKVYWPDGTDSHLGYLSMPALIPAGTHKQLPPMTNIAPTPPPARAQRRSDNRLPEEPLCPAIRLYLAREASCSLNEV